VIIAVLIYPLLSLFEKEPWYGRLFVQKSPGEIKRSLLMLFFMFAAVVAVSWGLLRNPNAAAAAILMWGVGDATAALVGIPFGKHKVRIKHLSSPKSWEGSCSMFLVSALTGIVLLWLFCRYPAGTSFLCAVIMAAAGTIVELFSPSEWDTVTVPAAMLAAALIML
jgi:dolichol kinase